MAESNRGPWIMAVAIVLAAALVIGAWAYFRDERISCRDWQEEWGRVPHLPKLAEARPEGCRPIDVPG